MQNFLKNKKFLVLGGSGFVGKSITQKLLANGARVVVLTRNSNKIKSLKDVSKSNQLIVSFSDKIENSEQEIRSFLRHRMYDNKSVLNKNQRGKMIIKKLFKIIKSNPRKFLTKEQLTKDKYRAISDFISGMTDRYAINLYNDNK